MPAFIPHPMTNSAEPALHQHRLWAIAMLLPVLLACLSSCHSTTLIQGKKTDLGAEFVYEQTLDKKDAGNYDYHYRGEHKGVHTSGDGKLTIIATDGKLTMKAAELNSGKSQVYLYGAKGVDAEAGEIVEHTISACESKQRGFLKRSHTRDYESWEAHQVKTSDITGDSVALVADRGDINAVGSNIVGEHGALLQTRQGNITLKAGENTYHSEERHSKHKVGLMGSGGIGVTLGSRSQSSDATLDLKGHTATVVGAIDGNVTIDAGGHYREQGAIVHAGRAGGPLTKEQWLALSPAERDRAGNVYLNAQSAELDVMRGEQKQEMNSRYKQTGITVNLSGALVNAAQMARKNLQHLGKSDNARVKAMAAANAAWSGYKAVQAVNEAVQSGSGGTLINLSISGGSQHSSSHQKSREDILQSSQLTGDSGVYLNIRGKGAGSTLNITGSDLGGSAVTMLNVEGKKTFQAAETRREIHSDQHSGGGGGGIALQGGSNGGGLGITANANIGKGETNGQSTTYRLSHIGGLSGHTDIGDGKTLLNGAQILGKSIEGNTRDLEIHSPQGTMDYQSRQNALSGNVLYGYGVSVNLDYQNTRVDAHEKTVNIDSGQRDAVRGVQESGNNRIQALTGSIKQNDALANSGQDKTGGVSGFYAGDDGYRIHNTGTTVLGGLITSTAKAEAEGKNHFSTDRLVREEIHNYSNYKGKSIALGVSTVLSGDTLEQGEAQRREFMDVGKSGVGKTFGIGREQRSQEGVTIGSVNTANLTIGDDAGQRLLTGESAAEAAKNANRGITLEHVKEHNGTTSVSFDADKVTRDITSTAQVMQGFDGTTQGIKHDLRKQADAYRERGDEETAAKLDKLAIGVDMLKGGLTPTDSALGTIANTAAPLVSYQIGQYAKAHGSEGSAGHIAAHAALAALTSAANGGSGTDMATSAAITGAAEYSAPLVAKGFYGTSDSSKLTAEQKETISNILGLAAAGAGAAVGNSTTAYGASRAAENAVENNQLTNPYGVKHLNEKELAVHNILYKAGVEDVEPYQQAFNQAQTVEERDAIIQQMKEADERSSKIVHDVYMRGELTRDQLLDTYILSYAEKMMHGAGEGDKANGKLGNAGWLETSPYTYNSHSWTPAGIEKNNYIHSARVHAIESKLQDQSRSKEELEDFRLRTDAVKSLTDGIPGPDVGRKIYASITSEDPLKAINTISLLKKAKPLNNNIDTFKNNYPEDPVVLQHVPRELIKDKNGRFWLKSPNGRMITPSGSYNYVTLPDGRIIVARPNVNTGFSTHLGLSRGGEVRYAGEIRFFNNAGPQRGNISYWNSNSGHYTPSFEARHNAGLPLNLYKENGVYGK